MTVTCNILDCAIGIAAVGDRCTACIGYFTRGNCHVHINAHNTIGIVIVILGVEVPPTVVRSGCRYRVGIVIARTVRRITRLLVVDTPSLVVRYRIGNLLVGVRSA